METSPPLRINPVELEGDPARKPLGRQIHLRMMSFSFPEFLFSRAAPMSYYEVRLGQPFQRPDSEKDDCFFFSCPLSDASQSRIMP